MLPKAFVPNSTPELFLIFLLRHCEGEIARRKYGGELKLLFSVKVRDVSMPTSETLVKSTDEQRFDVNNDITAEPTCCSQLYGEIFCSKKSAVTLKKQDALGCIDEITGIATGWSVRRQA